MISVFRPLHAAPEAVGMPCIVFAGNVGGDQALAQVGAILNAHRKPVTMRSRPGGRRGQATAAAARSKLPSICSFDTRGYRLRAFWSRTPLQS